MNIRVESIGTIFLLCFSKSECGEMVFSHSAICVVVYRHSRVSNLIELISTAARRALFEYREQVYSYAFNFGFSRSRLGSRAPCKTTLC